MKNKVVSLLKSALAIGIFLLMQTVCGILYRILYVPLYYLTEPLYSSCANPAAVFADDFLLILTALSDILTVAVFAVLFMVMEKRFSAELGIRRLSGCDTVVCAALGFGVCIALSLLLAVLPLPEQWFSSYSDASGTISEATLPAQLFCSVLTAPFAEELVFRGYIHTRLKRAFPTWCAALFSALLFGAVHGTLLWFFYTAALGLLLCFVYERFSSLWASVLVHMFFNLCGAVLADYPNLLLILLTGGYLLVFGFANLPPRKKASPENISRDFPKKKKSIFTIEESEDIHNA